MYMLQKVRMMACLWYRAWLGDWFLIVAQEGICPWSIELHFGFIRVIEVSLES